MFNNANLNNKNKIINFIKLSININLIIINNQYFIYLFTQLF